MRMHSESADGRRVMKSNASAPALNTLYWYGTGSDAVMETDLSNNMRYNYFFFGGQRVGRSDISKGYSLLLALLLIVGSHAMAHAENSPTCRRWIAEVTKGGHAGASDEKKNSPTSLLVPESDPWGVASLSEADKLQAIECFLTLENDLGPAAFGGAVRLDVSQTFAPAHVNLAALYAISYVYSGRYDHAAAVALRGEGASTTDSSGHYVTKSSAVRKAYCSYRAWFAKVRALGLARAKQQGLQPLEGSGLRWY